MIGSSRSANLYILIASFGLALMVPRGVSHPPFGGWGETAEAEFWSELNECTTGLASGRATADGRPLLWKNRDVGNPNQEFHYYDDGRIPFISITYRGETDEYYGGINAAGFALENSNSYNLEPGPYYNGWGYGDDDGHIHTLALATCRTVDDFEALLDSTNEAGRTLNCNYGAFDALGGAAMFETGGHSYTRVDAEETEDGFVIRSNYSYSGYGLNNRPSYWGPNRHDRAYSLWKWAVENRALTAQYVYQQTIRNLNAEGMTDYSLPYDGYYQDYPYGVIPNPEVICRSTTRGIMVAQGVRPGEPPEKSIFWVMGGTPLGSVATPLWVRAGDVPREYRDPDGARICNRALEIASWIYTSGPWGTGVDTWRLTNPWGTGYWDWSVPFETRIFNKVYRFLQSPGFSWDRLEAFQNEIAQQVADSMEAWRPAYIPTEIAEMVFMDDGVTLRWNAPGGRVLGRDRPSGYAVYRSDHPFRARQPGERIAVVDDQVFTDRHYPDYNAFYRVEALYQ